MSEQVMIPLQTVTDLANWLLWHRDATIMDVMAEFDLNREESLYALATARYVIRELERERREGGGNE